VSESTITRKGYTLVFVALMILLLISIVAARFELGRWNTPVALAISVAKAVLVVLFFMHVYQSNRLTQLAAAAGLLWLTLLMLFTLSDYFSRGWRSVIEPPTPGFRREAPGETEIQTFSRYQASGGSPPRLSLSFPPGGGGGASPASAGEPTGALPDALPVPGAASLGDGSEGGAGLLLLAAESSGGIGGSGVGAGSPGT
jgi:cytochrome c oxidase subunit 4